jgi:hypothetical protein
MSENVSKEQIDAWFDSGPITEEMLSLWLGIINRDEKQSP